MAPSNRGAALPFRVTLDGQPLADNHGADADADGPWNAERSAHVSAHPPDRLDHRPTSRRSSSSRLAPRRTASPSAEPMSTNDVVPLTELIDYITNTYKGVDVVTYPPDQTPTAWFFSLDAEKHWPNFATIVTTDEHDTDPNSNLSARGAYRLNIGVGRQSFERLVDPNKSYDYTATDVVIPHPTYAKQRWIGIVNPTRGTFDREIKQLLDEAHARLAK